MSDAIIMKYNDKNHQTFEPDENIWDSPGSPSLIGNSQANQDNVTVACNNFSLSDEQLMQNNIYDQYHSQMFLNKLHKIKIDTIKSPISKLYEVMAMMNKPLDFKVVSVEGKLHCLNFVMEVRSDKLMAIGKGSSIKKSKKEASIALLENIYSNFSNDTIMSTTPNHSPSPLNENNRVNIQDNQDNVTVTCNNFSLSDEQLMQNNIYVQQNSQKFLNKLHKIKIDTIKSPISKLYEIMTMMKKSLYFEVVSVEGKSHCLNFVMEVRSDKLMAIGKGSTIKKAKKEASIALLENIYSNFSNDTIMATTPNHSPSPLNENNRVNIQTPFENTHKDPICQLEELCMCNHWPMPNYQYFYRRGLLNNVYFVIKCTLVDLKFQATSKSKKIAKRRVAQLMYNHITKLLITKNYDIKCHLVLLNNKLTFDEDDTNYFSKLSTASIENRICIRNLKLSKNSGIKTLKKMNADALYLINAFELLSQISNEESFIVSYTVVSQMTINVIVLIEVYLQPVVANADDGKSVDEAKECCARTVLLYIKQLL